jgi:hypothetical protein
MGYFEGQSIQNKLPYGRRVKGKSIKINSGCSSGRTFTGGFQPA